MNNMLSLPDSSDIDHDDGADNNISKVVNEADGEDQKGNLQKYCENYSNFGKATHKLPFLYGIILSLPNPPNLKEDPYTHKLFQNKKRLVHQPMNYC